MATIKDGMYRMNTAEGFVAGGIAACGAVTVTNPMEVAKTRLQLDGELAKASQRERVYNNSLDALRKTAKHDGLRGIQRGLGAAYAYQIMLNGCRLGFYEPMRRSFNKATGKDVSQQLPLSNILAGSMSGVVGAICGNPLFLVKARMQAYSSHNPVGSQHKYQHTLAGLLQIFKNEGGLRGLFRGVDGAMLRTAMGSSVQLPAYGLAKSYLAPIFPADSVLTYLASSSFSGFCVLLMMQPADTVLTRLYTGKNTYKGPIDCLYKTFKAEGVRGWYKGSVAHFMRIAPHTILTLTLNETICQSYAAWQTKRQGITLPNDVKEN